MKRYGKKLVAAVVAFGIFASLAGGPVSGSADEIYRDLGGHWGRATVEWGAKLGIVNGFPDGSFRPDDKVTQSQFVTMLLRAFPKSGVRSAVSGDWYKPYYDNAVSRQWPVSLEQRDTAQTRGDAARIVAAAQGKLLGVDAAVQYLLDTGLAKGKTSATLSGFGKNDAVTRAEAVQFIKNALDSKMQLSDSAQAAKVQKDREYVIRGISLGMSEKDVKAALGQPNRIDASEYGFQWYIYNKDYSKYVQVGVQNGEVVGLYSNSNNWTSKSGIKVGMGADDARRKSGFALDSILKGNTRYLVPQTGEFDLFLQDGAYVTLFYDKHEDMKVTAVQVIEEQTELAKEGFYGTSSDAIGRSYELQIFDLANAVRVRMGLKPFAWDDKPAGTARKHAVDMAERDFFEHTNPDGANVGDRLETDQIAYRLAGENIAAGQTSAIFAHEGWMNSEGHRKNVLGDFERLGVGVAFGGRYHVYYAQNFYTPF
ncbi:CAP-associated domain-containing protein [Paenibacillus turpanensis]|uniref:CAP-associated domain-containing protein n=1 Tax=Paenibacillus turpanensis TaxID=2689078 RepID=UPI00140BCECC|nr:CAP-associated domain-containing protein [Paenibacillus turpanensis]